MSVIVSAGLAASFKKEKRLNPFAQPNRRHRAQYTWRYNAKNKYKPRLLLIAVYRFPIKTTFQQCSIFHVTAETVKTARALLEHVEFPNQQWVKLGIQFILCGGIPSDKSRFLHRYSRPQLQVARDMCYPLSHFISSDRSLEVCLGWGGP